MGSARILALTAILAAVVALAAAVFIVNRNDDDGVDGASYMTAEVRGFLDADPRLIPDEYKTAVLEALKDGSVAPERVHEVIGDLRRGDCSTACLGRVVEVTSTKLTVEPLFSPERWSIAVDENTHTSRGSDVVPHTDLRRGEMVQVLSQTGSVAEMVRSFSEPIRRP